ncbi:hypothetical protein C2G38_2033587 [Gigaspora rosea]|uniref:Uncharacterized protein n=1 Tax=Gigaspora rosea TaxID=44941 RepID=A0A397VKR8_9GLOM|nr:hypothetical protein C2G38_2033587 [Gigaspora rosea]
MDPLVVKHSGWPATKHLKSFSETQGHKEPIYNNNAIDPQDPNLRISLLNADSNNNNEDRKRKYVIQKSSKSSLALKILNYGYIKIIKLSLALKKKLAETRFFSKSTTNMLPSYKRSEQHMAIMFAN